MPAMSSQARLQHLFLFDAVTFLRSAYEASSTHLPIAISAKLAAWEEVRRDLYVSPVILSRTLREVRDTIENEKLGDAAIRISLLAQLDSLAPASSLDDESPLV